MESGKKLTVAFICAITLFLTSCKKEQLILIATESANDRFHQSETWNRKNPSRTINVKTNNYLIMAVADSHVEDGNTNNLDHFFNVAKALKPAAVFFDGDLTDGRSDQYDEFQRHLPVPDSLLTFLIAGNHDVYFNGWKEFYSKFGSSSYFVTVKTPSYNDLCICLDSSGGTLGNCQMEWLANTLQELRSNFRYCIVFTHNNLFREHHTPSTNPMTEELQVLIGLFTRYDVEMVITGHDHKRAESLFGITRYVQLDAIQDGKNQASYFEIYVNNDGLDYWFENIRLGI